MSQQVVVCSYQRAQALRDKTLALLARCGVAPGDVLVVVADEAERSAYASVLAAGTYGRLVTAAKGLHAARNAVAGMFPEGTPLLFMDDDIESIWQLTGENAWAETRNLAGIAERGFRACHEQGCRLWGVYPVLNAFFMRNRLVVGSVLVPGGLYGVLNTRALPLTTEEHEDYERTLQHVEADGRVARFDDVTVKTRCWAPGGMSVGRDRPGLSKEAVIYLQTRFPELVGGTRTKRNGVVNPLIRRARDTLRLPVPPLSLLPR